MKIISVDPIKIKKKKIIVSYVWITVCLLISLFLMLTTTLTYKVEISQSFYDKMNEHNENSDNPFKQDKDDDYEELSGFVNSMAPLSEIDGDSCFESIGKFFDIGSEYLDWSGSESNSSVASNYLFTALSCWAAAAITVIDLGMLFISLTFTVISIIIMIFVKPKKSEEEDIRSWKPFKTMNYVWSTPLVLYIFTLIATLCINLGLASGMNVSVTDLPISYKLSFGGAGYLVTFIVTLVLYYVGKIVIDKVSSLN